ncbi:uncharacterized protein LOC109835258 [Asparagus officinalis]|uniref:uncharacterized protein LOC109835258 n=1 Tax=Asparagus officinalis TaxID=4686 RepID=UPI00098E3301|nr:uncharacterized protein LOC109835258 [Asparagus officinalis]
MINWIMSCISSPKYSISINGSIHGYFKGERGLRQGDPLSPYLFILGMEYLSRDLDMLKNDKLFKFHPRCGKFKITHLIFADDLLLFSRGDIYSVGKLHQCIRNFSYISGLEANASKCSIFFGGVQLCRDFLWGKSSQSSKMPLVAWNNVCMDRKKGGLGVYSATSWNLAATLKILWQIHSNKESLWIKWVHGTYLRRNDIWNVTAKNSDSWMWKQMIKARDRAALSCGGINNLLQLLNVCGRNTKFHISALYHDLLPVTQQVPWHYTVWDQLSYPKHSFISWLAVLNKLLTKDRLMKRGLIIDGSCCLCSGAELENRNHLFFSCKFSSEVWNGIMSWLQFTWRSCEWDHILEWFCTKLRGKGFKQGIRRIAFTAAIYNIWTERNLRIFQQEIRTVTQLIKRIKMDILSAVLNSQVQEKFRHWLQSL